MQKRQTRTLRILMILAFSMASLILLVNYIGEDYSGNFYFLENALFIYCIGLLIRLGLSIQLPLHHKMAQMIDELNNYMLVIMLVLFGTTAIQYTPHLPIDTSILKIEKNLHLNLDAVVAWMNNNPVLMSIAEWFYNSLGYQLVLFPLVLILARKHDVIHQFYVMALITWIIGLSFYYFFPTTGPASMIDSPFFSEAQHATGLKFWQVHHYITPETKDGGMIAMPSFHVIWAWLCVNLLRPWPWAFCFLGVFNAIIVVSCVTLGWHYFLDVVASAIILMSSHAIYYFYHPRQSVSEFG